MRRFIARGLAIAFSIVGLGAAQGPNISEAIAAPVSSVQARPEVRQQVKTKPYQIGTASWYGRIIDLSYGAAQALQFKQRGLQRVRLELVNPRDQKSVNQMLAYNHPPIAK